MVMIQHRTRCLVTVGLWLACGRFEGRALGEERRRFEDIQSVQNPEEVALRSGDSEVRSQKIFKSWKRHGAPSG